VSDQDFKADTAGFLHSPMTNDWLVEEITGSGANGE
jgi:hypothetical protein